MKHIRLFVAAFALVIGLGGLVPAVAMADTAQTSVCKALGSNDTCTSNPSGSVSLNNVISTIVTILSIVIGVAAVIMIMVGGFRYITSGGDSNKVSSAKNTLIYAIIGLVVAVSAKIIVQFVLGKVK